MIRGFPDNLINYLKSRVNDNNDEEFEKIIKNNNYLFIITCSGVGCSIFILIFGIIYYKKLKIKTKKKDKDLLKGYGDESKMELIILLIEKMIKTLIIL